MHANAKLMREWLQQNGHTVSSRGPISAANKQLFYTANPQYSPDSKEPAREAVRKQVAMEDMEARGADKREMKQDYNDITVPRIVQEAAADVSKKELERLVKDSIPIEIIRQNIDKPLLRLNKHDWAELYRKVVVGQIKSEWVDETQAMSQQFAPEEAAALPGPSAPKVAPRNTMQGGSELSYDTLAQTIPSFGGSSAAPPEPDTHVDNRLRIELFWPDPLTPSEERRWIFIDLTANYG